MYRMCAYPSISTSTLVKYVIMRKMRQKVLFSAILMGLSGWAGAEPLRFPTTEADIVTALSPTLQRKGLGGITSDTVKVGAFIQFDSNSAQIKKESYPLLREYAKALQGSLATVRIEIAGHTDSRGDAAYNLRLSRQRAQAVQDFLGVDNTTTYVTAYGETQAIKTNNTPEGRAYNRRVEFIRVTQ